MMVGVSSRTRSKNVRLYGSSNQRKNGEVDVCFSASCSKKRKANKEPFVLPPDAEVISIDDENEDDAVEKKSEGCADVKKEVESDEFVDEKPIVIGSDESGESDEEDSGCDESEENESSDEDFSINEVNEVCESDEDGSSSCSSYVDEAKRNSSRKYLEAVGEMVRKVKDDEKSEISKNKIKSSDDVTSEISKRKKIKSSDDVTSEISKNKKIKSSDDVTSEISKRKKIKSSDDVTSEISKRKKIKSSDDEKSVISKKKKMKSSDDESKHDDDDSVTQMEGCSSSSKLDIASGTKEEKNVFYEGKGGVKHYESLNLDEGKEQNVQGLDDGEASVSMIQTEEKVIKNKGRDYKDKATIQNDKKKETVANKGVKNQRGKNTLFMAKELRMFELLAEFYWGNKDNAAKNDSTPLEVKNDDVNCPKTRPPQASVETRPLIWSLKKKEIVQNTKEEEELARLWDEMQRSLRETEAESMIGKYETTHENMGNPSTCCEHDLRHDEEIGVYCRICRWVKTEIKHVSEQVVDKFPKERSRKRASFNDVNDSHFDGSQFKLSDNDSESSLSHDEGTVWDLIPDVKQTLYPHQQEGFEFIWKNLAGSIDLHKLKNADPQSEGGCIISHAPGTGKTRLTIVFLGTYLKFFPKCLPVIVAPASLLLTWEEEFKKWDIGVPFHNLSNLELSGKEHDGTRNLLGRSNSADTTRMAKLISWNKERSILGISYNLYEKLAGGGGLHDEKNKNQEIMGNVLREKPGLLVLDEGHTPRNRTSAIWKVLSKSQTKKRVILSGTPFQNNFLELYNTLSIVKPSFPTTLPHELKKFCQKPEQKKATKEWSWQQDSGNTSDNKIKQLKLLMDPLVHVHKGAILEKKLPGIRSRVLRLKPDSLQKQTIESIPSCQSTFTFEHKLTMASIHPSLFLECELSEKEESILDKEKLEKIRLDPSKGVKTRFLVEFVKLCDAVNEKVLVFSQFIKPLRLIIEQLSLACKWTEGKEMLFMDGEVDFKGKQSLINNFNDANCQAKILLASVKANSEGISLVGASRVVLLDVVWNPSVKRQAISRAYRIGQKRVVYTYHLLIDGTTECVKHWKQAEKDRLSELVFQGKNNDNDNDELEKCAVKFEDSVLDKMIHHKELKDMFVE